MVRFRQRGGVLALLLVSLIAISGTAAGHGLFSGAGAIHAPSPHERLFRVQCFMAVTAVSMMFIAAALAERRQAILARDEFISIASHELKTPLTALRLRLATALKVLGSERPTDPAAVEKAARAVTAATSTTDRLGRLIEDLLDVSRLTARRLDLSPEEIPVRELLGEVAARLREAAVEAGSAVVIEIDDAAGPLIATWDRGRIEQVVTNLLANAIKYGSSREITIAARADGTRISIIVRDGGIGIAKADQERIFQAFERVESVHRVGGLGLGLYIGRQIAGAHGGTLRVVSEPGRGSTFVLDLPRALAPRLPGAEREISGVREPSQGPKFYGPLQIDDSGHLFASVLKISSTFMHSVALIALMQIVSWLWLIFESHVGVGHAESHCARTWVSHDSRFSYLSPVPI